MLLTFEILGRARNHGEKLPKLSHTSFSEIVNYVDVNIEHYNNRQKYLQQDILKMIQLCNFHRSKTRLDLELQIPHTSYQSQRL